MKNMYLNILLYCYYWYIELSEPQSNYHQTKRPNLNKDTLNCPP